MTTNTIKSKNIQWFRNRLLIWAKDNLRDYPWRRTDRAYDILVAEFLLQKTDADTVAPVYESFLRRYHNLDSLAAADVEEIAELIKPLGLFFRAERLLQTARTIVEQHQGIIPDRETELLKLPGIGMYTARAILSQAFDKPTAVMDSNVARILERFFGIKGERVKSRCKILWSSADKIAPQKKVGYWNLILLDFGALICSARNPKCFQCPIALECCWLNSNKDRTMLAAINE